MWLSLDTRGMTLGDSGMERHFGMLMSVGSLFLGCKQLPFSFTLEQRCYSLIPNGKEPCSLMNKVLDTRFYSANQGCILATVTHTLTNSITDLSMC